MLSSQQLSWETFLKAMNEGDPEILMVPSISDRSGTQNMVFRFWNFGKQFNKSFPYFFAIYDEISFSTNKDKTFRKHKTEKLNCSITISFV